MKRIMGLFILILAFTMSASLSAREVGSEFQWLSLGDAAYKIFDNEGALELYRKAFETDPHNYEAAWKLARAYVDVGERLSDKWDRRSNYKKAYKYAKRAVATYPDGSKGHLYLSIALGRVALDAGPKERVKLSEQVKSEVDKALALDPADDIGWHVLGRWHRRLSTLSWIEKKFAHIFLGGIPKEASMDKAAESFRKAIQLNHAHINHHLELAITYDKMREKGLAIEEYRKVLELPIADMDDADHKKRAKKRLKRIE
jgi:tetratricopeptide (TPR) repeat protein